MSPPATTTNGSPRHQARQAAGERSLERRLIVDEADTVRQGRLDVRWRDDDDVGGDGGHGFDGRGGAADGHRSTRRACRGRSAPSDPGKDDPARCRQRGRGHVPPRAPTGAADPGRGRPCAGGCHGDRDPRGSPGRSGGRAGRVTERRGREGFAGRERECLRRQVAVRGHRVAEILLEDDDPSVSLELADRRRRAAERLPPHEAAAALVPPGRRPACPSPRRPPDRPRPADGRASRTRSPSRTRRPSDTRSSTRTDARAAASAALAVAWRRSAFAAAERTAANVGPASPGRAAWCARTASRAAPAAAARTSGATSRSPATMPCNSIRATRTAARSPACAAGSQVRHALGGLPTAGDAPRGQWVEDHAPEHGRPGGRRPAQHEPVTGRSGDRRIEAQHGGCGTVGSSSASRPARPTTASAAAVPRWTRKRVRSGTGAASMTSSRSEGTRGRS